MQVLRIKKSETLLEVNTNINSDVVPSLNSKT